MEIVDKHIVVTGGASGIGRALCRRFAAEGARAVVVADLDREGATAVAKQVNGLAVGVDVSREEQVRGLVAHAMEESGPIDLFCSNAGVAVPGDVETTTDEGWELSWGVNVSAHLYAARAVLPSMLERGEGYLLQTCSAAGLLSQIGSAAYSATKHAAVGLAEWLAITYGERGIKVSALCPQAVNTAMTADSEGGGVAGVDGMMEPEELADAVVQGLADERFLILPHPEVATYVQRKAADVDRWVAGMQRLQRRYVDGGLAPRD